MRKITLIMLCAALILSILHIAVSCAEFEREDTASEKEVVVCAANYAYNEGELLVDFTGGVLTISVIGMPPEYSYQYWAYRQVDVEGLSDNNYIWQIVGAYCKGQTELEFAVDECYIDGDGNYLVMVRVKDGSGNFIGQLRGAVSREEAGQVGITSVAADGEICEDRYVVNIANGQVRFNISGYNATNYIFMNGQAVMPGGEGQEFVWDISKLAFGWYDLTFIAENQTDRAMRNIKVYIYGDYAPSEMPVIRMDIDDSDPANPKVTLVTSNSDGSKASGEYNYTLSANGKTYKNTSGVFDIKLGEGQYGVYVIHGSVSRKGVSGIDDECRIWYDYSRLGNIELKIHAERDVLSPNEELIITAEAKIDRLRAGEKLLYSFVKYDASGWTTIKNYSESPTLNWRPLRQGTYKIYARVMGSMSGGDYEREVARDFHVEDSAVTLDGDLSVGVYDYNGNSISPNGLRARRPYLIKAEYTGDEDVVYRFTLWDRDMKLIIAKRYSPESEYSFIARKDDEYVVTVQVISVSGYGYKELDSPLTLVVDTNSSVYEVVFHSNNGKGQSSSQTFEYNESKALAHCTFESEGKLFIGWAESETSAVKFINREIVVGLSTANFATVNLYAVWAEIAVESGIEVLDKPVKFTASVQGAAGGAEFTFTAPNRYVTILNSETDSPALLAVGGAFGIADMTVTAAYNGSFASVNVPISVFKPISTKAEFLAINALDSCSYYITSDIALGTLQAANLKIRNIDGYPSDLVPISVIDVVGSQFVIDGKGYNLSYTIDTKAASVSSPVQKEISLISWLKGEIRNLHVSAKTIFNIGGSHSSFVSRVSAGGRVTDCRIDITHQSTNSGLVLSPIKMFEGEMKNCIINNSVKFSPTLGEFYHMFTGVGGAESGLYDNVIIGSKIYENVGGSLNFTADEVRLFTSIDEAAADEGMAFKGFDFSENGSWIKIYDIGSKLIDIRLRRS